MKIPYEALSLEEAIHLLGIMNGYFDADSGMIILEDEPIEKSLGGDLQRE